MGGNSPIFDMKILFFNKQIGNGGAEKKSLIMGKYLKQYYNCNVASLCWADNHGKLLENGISCFAYPTGNSKTVIEYIKSFNPDIIHTIRSGEHEDNFDIPLLAVKDKHIIVESNVFGHIGGVCNYRLPISGPVRDRIFKHGKGHINCAPENVEVLHNPVEPANFICGDLREELKIPKDAFVFGRISRSDDGIYCPLEIEAYKEFCKKITNQNIYYISLGEPKKMLKDSKKLRNFISIPETPNPVKIAKFYNTLNVLLHANNMGESLGTKIQEAMTYGIPVVTHSVTSGYNAHITDLLPPEYPYITNKKDVGKYTDHMVTLYNNENIRQNLKDQFKTLALKWAPDIIVKKLHDIYEKLLSPGGKNE